MRKCLVRAQWVAIVMLVGSLTLSLTGNVASAADSELCVFVKKVLAASKDEFAPLKGAEHVLTVADGTMFNGTLMPAPDADCTLVVRRKLRPTSKDILPPAYDCWLAHQITFDQAEARYAALAKDLKACLAGFKSSEEKSGGHPDRDEIWELTAIGPDTKVTMGFSDIGALADLINRTTSTAPGVAISLGFEDTAPGPANAQLPVLGQKAK